MDTGLRAIRGWAFALALALALAALALACVPAAFADSSDEDDPGFTIDSYDVAATVHADDTVSVTETIAVDFYLEKHGLYRDIPTVFYVGSGITGAPGRSYPYEAWVTDIDTGLDPVDVSNEEGAVRLRLGSEDETVTGPKTYTISYVYHFPNDRLDTLDFLYFSVLGTGWGMPVRNFTFNVAFDEPLPQDAVESMRVYSGDAASETDAVGVVAQVSANGVQGAVERVPANQAVTLFGVLPQGYFDEPPATSPVPAAVLLALSVPAALVAVVLMVRRSRMKPTKTVEFYPPEGLLPAEVGVVIDDSADLRDLIALIPWWAERGYLEIERQAGKKRLIGQAKDRIVLKPLSALPADAADFELAFFNALFREVPGGPLRDRDLGETDENLGDAVEDAKTLLRKSFTGDRTLVKHSGQAFVLSALPLVLVAAAIAVGSEVSYTYNLVAGAAIAVVALLIALFRFCWHRSGHSVAMAVITVAAAVFEAGMVIYACADYLLLPENLVDSLAIAYLVLAFFQPKLLENTPYRVALLGKLWGLQEFIRTAELPRLKMLLKENESYFYDVLPFAIALGLEDEWARDFEGIELASPGWYGDSTGAAGSSVWIAQAVGSDMVTSMSDSVASSISAAQAASTASGAGAGGGGGGGGGGSW